LSIPQVMNEYKMAILHVGITNELYYSDKSRSKSAVTKELNLERMTNLPTTNTKSLWNKCFFTIIGT